MSRDKNATGGPAGPKTTLPVATSPSYVGECDTGAVYRQPDGRLTAGRRGVPVVECPTCRRFTTFRDRCGLCYSVESRLVDYLRAPKARMHVAAMLRESTRTARHLEMLARKAARKL